MTINQESYALPPWDEPGGKSKWGDRVRDGLKRARTGYLEADFSQRDLPFGDETVVRMLTTRFGERYWHFLNSPTDPEGGATSVNCCAPAEFQGPRDDICPVCAYAKERGGRDEGGADMNHNYYLILIRGKITTVFYKDKDKPNEPGVPKREIVWDETPLTFECTNGIYGGIFKYHNDVDFPPEANGDITKYAFKINKKKGTTSINTKYEVTPMPTILPPLEVPTDRLREKWEYIRKLCQPADRSLAARKLGLEIAQGAQGRAVPTQETGDLGGDFELEPPISQKAQSQTVSQKPPDEEDIF